MNAEEFREVAKEKGYGEVELLEVETGPEEEMHSHEHSVLSFVLTGEITMTTNEWMKVLLPGDMTENPAGTMHKVKIGAEGGLVLVCQEISSGMSLPHNNSNAAGPGRVDVRLGH